MLLTCILLLQEFALQTSCFSRCTTTEQSLVPCPQHQLLMCCALGQLLGQLRHVLPVTSWLQSSLLLSNHCHQGHRCLPDQFCLLHGETCPHARPLQKIVHLLAFRCLGGRRLKWRRGSQEDLLSVLLRQGYWLGLEPH